MLAFIHICSSLAEQIAEADEIVQRIDEIEENGCINDWTQGW